MKVFRFFLFLIPLFSLIFYSCTKIDAPYAASKHGNIKDTTMNWDTIKAVKKVLLEDYTGHKCVNCPEAAITARSLEELYEGKLIVMAVHAGFYALPGSGEYTLDLRTQAGEDWNNEFKLVSYPSGMINRKDFGGSRILGPDKWGNSISEIIDTPPDAQMMFQNSYDSTSGTLLSTVFTHFINPISGTYNITVCLLEDSIIGAQKNNNPNIGPYPDWYNYVFNDVLRGSLNSSWGEVLTTSVDTRLTYMGRFSETIDPGSIIRNCWILAFVSNSSTREIIQIEKKKIVP